MSRLKPRPHKHLVFFPQAVRPAHDDKVKDRRLWVGAVAALAEFVVLAIVEFDF